MTSATDNSSIEHSLQDLLHSMQQRNLVYNHDFAYFSNVQDASNNDFGIPDGWIYSDSGKAGQITRIDAGCKIVTGSGEGMQMHFQQSLHEFPRWETRLRGQLVTAKAELSLDYSCRVGFSLDDGVGCVRRVETSIGDTTLIIQRYVDPQAKFLKVVIDCDTPQAIVRIRRVCANIGTVALDHLPCMVEGIIGEVKQYVAIETPPLEELSLCSEQRLLGSGYSRLDSIINKKFGQGDGGYSLLPDMRGRFCRAWNNGGGVDPDIAARETPGNPKRGGDLVGTVQDDAFMQHDHGLLYAAAGTFRSDAGVSLIGSGKGSTGSSGGKETRPKNISILYTIKWA